MTGIFAKLRTAALSNIHTVLDKVIDLNSTGAIKQHIRDLETARDSIADETAVARGNVAALEVQIKKLQNNITTTNGQIELVVSDEDPSNDHLAEPLMKRVMDAETEINEKTEELEVAKTVSTGLTNATTKLTAKLGEMTANLRRLTQLERTTAAKEKAASALTQAARASAAGSGASIDSVEERLRQRATVADSRFDRAVGEISDTVSTDVQSVEARQRITALRAKLAGNKAGGVDTGT